MPALFRGRKRCGVGLQKLSPCFREGAFGAVLLFEMLLHRLRDLLTLCGKQHGDSIDRVLFSSVVREGPLSAGNVETDTALVVHDVRDLHDPHLGCGVTVGGAAGADVDTRDLDDPDVVGEFQLAPVIQILQGLLLRKPGLHRDVRPDGPVHFQLQLLQSFGVDGAAEIKRGLRLAQVEAHIVVAESCVHPAGKHVLAGVLLHEIKAPRPVDLSGHRGSFLQRTVQHVGDDPALHMGVQDFSFPEGSPVRLLSALLRKKGGPIQDRQEGAVFFVRSAGKDLSRKFRPVHVFVIKLFCLHHFGTFLRSHPQRFPGAAFRHPSAASLLFRRVLPLQGRKLLLQLLVLSFLRVLVLLSKLTHDFSPFSALPCPASAGLRQTRKYTSGTSSGLHFS